MGSQIGTIAIGVILAVAGMASSAAATSVTFTMDEVVTQPIDGLTVAKGGIAVTYSDPGNGLYYDAIGPGALTFVDDPTIEGVLEPFSVSFSEPVTGIQFGLAERFGLRLRGAKVKLSNGSVLSFNLSLTDPFAEGQFNYSGAPVTGFTLTPAARPEELAFDNLKLTFGAVPEPRSWALALLGFGLMGATLRRQRRIGSRKISNAMS